MCLKNFGWSSVIVQEAENKTIPKKKKSKKAKWLSEEALQIAKERREAKSKGERERYIQLNADFQRKARETRQAFFNEQCIKLQENRRGKTRDLFRKIGNIKGAFCPKMGTIVDKNGKRPSRRRKDQEEMVQPCHIPFPIWNQSVVPCPVLTVAS